MQHTFRTRALATTGGVLVLGGTGLALATGAAAAPRPSTSPTAASSAPVSAAPVRPTLVPSPVSSEAPPSAAPGGIEVPAGNAGVRADGDATSLAAVTLIGGGVLLVGAGVTVAVRRRRP